GRPHLPRARGGGGPPLAAPGPDLPHHRGRVPLRRRRSRRRDRGARGGHGATAHLGDGAVPLVRPAALDGGPPRDRGGVGPPDRTGPGRRHGRRAGDLHRQRRARLAPARRPRGLGGPPRGAAPGLVPATAGPPRPRGHDHEPDRAADGIGPCHVRPRRHPGRRPGRPVGADRGPRVRGGRTRDPRRLGAVRHRPGARSAGGRQQPRQHPAGDPPRGHGVGAARHPHPRDRERLRTRLGAPVGGGRHPAGDRQPVGDRAVLGRGQAPPGRGGRQGAPL
ncbi:MAG: TesB-like acyl-CoA thioesterase 6, partial [uncultured Acidimicrobiales bacterium]